MEPIYGWLCNLNFQKTPSKEHHLEGEALAYALVTYLVRPHNLPSEVVITLAEDHFAHLVPSTQEH